MDVPEEPAAAIVLMAFFIVTLFSFLLALAKGWLSASAAAGWMGNISRLVRLTLQCFD
jgi:hypothetical protein